MADPNSAIQSLLGTGGASDTAGGDAVQVRPRRNNNVALKRIATNQSLLIQNVSKLTDTLAIIIDDWTP